MHLSLGGDSGAGVVHDLRQRVFLRHLVTGKLEIVNLQFGLKVRTGSGGLNSRAGCGDIRGEERQRRSGSGAGPDIAAVRESVALGDGDGVWCRVSWKMMSTLVR